MAGNEPLGQQQLSSPVVTCHLQQHATWRAAASMGPAPDANIVNSVGNSLPIYTHGARTDYVLSQCAWAGQTLRRLAV